MMFPKVWDEQTKMKTEVKFQSVQKAKKKPTNYLTDFQQEDKLKCLLLTVLGVHISQCLETNMELNGWLTLTQNITDKTKRTKNNERLTTVWQNGGFSAKLSIRNLIRYKPFPGDQIQSSQPSQFVRLFSLIGGQAFFFWLQRSKGRQIIPTDSSKLSSF